MHKLIVFVILFFVTVGLTGIAYGEINQNNAFILEGTGFGVDKKTINNSKMNFIFSTGSSLGSTISTTVKDGIFDLNTAEYIVDFKGTSYRDGQFLRFSGTATSSTVSTEKVSVSLFGRLIQDSAEGAVYGFTGKLTKGTQTQKLVYNAKISKLSDTVVATKTTEQKTPEVRILKGAATPSTVTYKDLASTIQQLKYLTPDRVTVKPGSQLTIINDDTKPHKIFSGTENYNDRHKPFTADGRIQTDVIQPGKSITITVTDKGFYRLYDPDYTWINMIVYSFPDVDSLKIRGTGINQN